MCCLFGIYDYGHSLTAAQKKRLVSALAVASDATYRIIIYFYPPRSS